MRKGGFSPVFFLLGLGSHLQVYMGGAMGLSEFFIFLAAPFLFAKNFALLKRDGFLPLLYLCLMSLVGCGVACIYNSAPFTNAIRGYMTNYAFFAAIVVMHHFLRKDLNGFKWCLLGIALSWLASTFVFQQATELYQYARNGGDTTEGIMSGPLYWASRLGGFWVLPYQGWYIQTPIAWNVLAPAIWAFVFVFISQGSGRSAALTLFAGAVIIALCRKSRIRIKAVSKKMGLIILVGLLMTPIITLGYKTAAASGALGEKAQIKYELQSRGGTSTLKLLVGGRAEFFVGLTACLRHPIIGYGPWAVDKEGIYEEWLQKYGIAEDVERYFEYKSRHEQQYGSFLRLIPAHSVIVYFWMSYGIFGLLLWLYILKLIWRYVRHDMDAIPQYIGFLAAAVPTYMWNIFFSPFGGRLEYGLFLSAILLTHVVKQGKLALPMDMQYEIFKNMK